MTGKSVLIFRYGTTDKLSHEGRHLSIGPAKALGPVVAPSSYCNKCLLACNKQTSHCNGLLSSSSRSQIAAPLFPVLKFVPSHPTATNLLVVIPLREKNQL